MIRIKFQAKNLNTGELLADEASVGSVATAHEELLQLIEAFNIEEKARYGDNAQLREFVAVDTGQEGQLQHDWHKKNLVGERNKDGTIVDTWQCRGCRLLRQVSTPDGVPHGGDCHPDRLCPACNRMFANKKNRDAHYIKMHYSSTGE